MGVADIIVHVPFVIVNVFFFESTEWKVPI